MADAFGREHWDSSRPFHQAAGEVNESDFLLTHALWWPFGDHGSGCPETGVRDKSRPGSFDLIQHGWRDFDAAGALILRALRKGWDAYRIGTLMDWLRARRRYPQGRVLAKAEVEGENRG